MQITFPCQCGETLRVPDSYSGRKVFCLRCRKSIPIPDSIGKETESTKAPAAKLEELVTSDSAPFQGELVHDATGKEHWKLTCICGKRLLSPVSTARPAGSCPKCGRKIRLPGYTAPVPIQVSATPGKGPVSAPPRHTPDRKDDHLNMEIPVLTDEDTVAAPLKPVTVDSNYNHDAAVKAADRLRPERKKAESVRGGASERIAAWPLSGVSRRLLAAFIDLTFATVIAGTVFVLARQGILPQWLSRIDTLAGLLILAAMFNDGLIQFIWGGSLGKKLVVIVVRGVYGEDQGIASTFLRALLKWLLIPGWIVGAIDPAERTLHDLICRTLVLKGRVKSRS